MTRAQRRQPRTAAVILRSLMPSEACAQNRWQNPDENRIRVRQGSAGGTLLASWVSWQQVACILHSKADCA